MNKFHAIRSGDGFPSKLEAAVYQDLCLKEKAGMISDIRRQVGVDLGFQITWKVDFSYFDKRAEETIYAEAKGMETGEYRLKLKLWRWGQGPGPLYIYKGSYQKPILAEIIIPRDLKCLK